jgi:hypothetical protein
MTEKLGYREAAARLRHSVVSGDYSEVSIALAEYRREVDAAVAGGHKALAGEAAELTRWALQVVQTARESTRQQYDQVSTILRYHEPAQSVPTWKMEG